MIEFSKQKLSVLIEKINSAQNIAVITHTNPDGDTVGASLSIYKILLNMGKKVSVISPDTLPEFLECLPNVEAILTYETQKNDVKSILQNADLVFCMDFNASHRVGILTHQLDKVTAFKILIDHHLMPDENFFDLIFCFDKSSSTYELLFHILRESDLLKYFDSDIATCIYVGIMTDTGSFSFACNRKEVFETVARLVELGDINLKKIHDNIYNSFSESRLRFLGFCINEKLVVLHEYHAAYIWVSMEEMERFNVSEGDLEGVVNYALSIKGIVIAALLKERKNIIKMSFRSKDEFSVNSFAKENFDGGGHINAAGGKSSLTMQDTIEKLVSLLKGLNL